MKIKFNYLVIGLCILILLFIVAFSAVSFSGKDFKTSHFENDEISFDYPDTWQIVNQTRNSEVVAFTDLKIRT